MGRGAAPWSRVLRGHRGGRLAGNRFSDGLPTDKLASCYLLERLFLPSIVYLSIAGNRFTGLLYGNVSYGENLQFVELSLKLLTGNLRPASAPTKNSDSKTVLFSRTLADAL